MRRWLQLALAVQPWPLFNVVNFTTKLATPPAPYRSLPGPLGPESRKVSSESLPGQTQKRLLFKTPETVLRLFLTLLGPWPEGPRKLSGDYCGGQAGLQHRTQCQAHGGGGWYSLQHFGGEHLHIQLRNLARTDHLLNNASNNKVLMWN